MSDSDDMMIAAIDKAVMDINTAVKTNGGGSETDVGVENMEHVGSISAKGLREMYAECARRELEAAQALLVQAQTYHEEAKVRARAAEQLGEEMAKAHLVAVDRARKMATHAATTRALIEKSEEIQ